MGDKDSNNSKVAEKGALYIVAASNSTAGEAVSGAEHFIWDVVRREALATSSQPATPKAKEK